MWTLRVALLLLLHHTGSTVSLPGPTPQSAQLGSDAVISCTFPVVTNPQIQWSFKNNHILTFDGSLRLSEPRLWLDTGQIAKGNASLVIRKVQIDDEGSYLCTVVYDGHLHKEKVKLSVRACPDLMVVKNTVVKNRKSIVSCLATGFHPIDIYFVWFIDNEEVEEDNFFTYKPQGTPSGTYRVNSTLLFVPTDEDTNKVFSCGIRHVSLTEPIQINFTIVFGEMPSIRIISSKFSLGRQQTLVCSVWGFYPENINVNWFLNDSLLEGAEHHRMNSSAMELTYTFTPRPEHQGMVLHCRVRHSTLVETMTESLPIILHEACSDEWRNHWIPVFFFVMLLGVLLGMGAIVLWHPKDGHACLIHVTDISVPPLVAKKEACLKCTVLCCHPNALIVDWLRRERGGLRVIPPSDEHYMASTESLLSGNTYCCTLSLTFTPSVQRDDGTEIICRVTHPSLSQPEERFSGTILVKRYPEVSEITMHDFETFVVSVDGIKPDVPLSVNWQLVNSDADVLYNRFKKSIKSTENEDGTFRTTSTCKPPAEYIMENQHYGMRAQIHHEELMDRVERTFKFERAKENLTRPFKNIPEESQREKKHQAAASGSSVTRPCRSCDSVAILKELPCHQKQEPENWVLCEDPSDGTEIENRKVKENSGENGNHKPSHEEMELTTCCNPIPGRRYQQII